MTAAQALWLGPVHSEARAAYHRARDTGLSPLRSLVVGSIASFKECWAFRTKLAAHVGCSVRTVQRAITQAKSEGLIGVARAKKGEKPPNWDREVPCGWSHRWVIGWGRAGEAVKQAVDAARARWIIRSAMVAPAKPAEKPPVAESQAPRTYGSTMDPRHGPRRRWTAAELDAELERLERLKRPPD